MLVSRSLMRLLAAGVLATFIAAGAAAPGYAVPPPPSNPSDSDIQAGKAQANAKAAQVGDLANQLSAAESKLQDLQNQVESKMEQANKAFVDLQNAEDAAKSAQDAANAAKTEADAAARAEDDLRQQLDQFASASYRQGSMVGSFSAFLDATSPENLLEKVQLLNVVGNSQLKALDELQRADIEKANKDSATRKALDVAKQKQDEAAAAKKTADAAVAAASAARKAQADQEKQLEASKQDVENQLADAQSKVSDLQAQRQHYQDWLAEKQREEAAQAAAAARPSQSSRPVVSVPASARAQIVIARAMAELGVTYAWGGGNDYGPTYGIRDGGVADEYGDYNKIGFDCSGLMVYAFAGVGIHLPHYSGYQYYAGTHIPLSQIQSGDMLFYGDLSDIHHVTLYIGGGRMIEAPESGSYVRVVPVRYGEIMPYATRVL